MELFLSALGLFNSPTVFAALLIGGIWGTIAGVLPGMGTVAALIIALPFTFAMPTESAMALFMAIYVTSVYGGSISAILINTPGTPQSAATVLDGYPMAQAGKADLAIGWATLASFIGGIFSLIILIVAAPALARVSVAFGPSAIFAIVLFALTCIAWLSSGSMAKGLLGGVLGLFLTTVGQDNYTGMTRFSFGSDIMRGGFTLIPILIGLFALSEVYHRALLHGAHRTGAEMNVGFRLPPLSDVVARWKELLRACSIGTFIGILPGTGAMAATFVSYTAAKRFSPNRDKLGTGEPDGLIASEASNNAVTGGALIPTMALGIPGDGGTLVLLGVLTIKGIVPGFDLVNNNPHILTAAFMMVLLANVIMFGTGMLSARLFERLLRVPEPILMGLILLFSLVGAFVVRGNPVDLIVCVVAGAAGVLLRLAKYPIAPIVIGVALGFIFEEKLRQGLIASRGSLWTFITDPIALPIFALTAVIIAATIVSNLRRPPQTKALEE
ncbi:tripartite tricarboxylate transporter permease [Hoeflea sp.]|uniref:tripartite tricarboxylate transporter permease n=1 Tax=Hoeflea sp. TaxID=1940281 RepID=UPI003B025511